MTFEFSVEKVEHWLLPPRMHGPLDIFFTSTFRPFEAAAAMKTGKRWEEKRHEYLRDDGCEMEALEIADLWAKRGREASARGTLLHFHTE